MKRAASLLLNWLLLFSLAVAQSSTVQHDAARSVQQSQNSAPDKSLQTDNGSSQAAAPSLQQTRKPAPTDPAREIRIPAGTRLDVEASYAVSSSDVRSGDLISFRVLIPISVSGVVVIEDHALVTARVVQAKRAGHWGKAGRLSWTMEDVVAIDGTRVPIQISESGTKSEGTGELKGTSHGAEVATKTVVLGALMAPIFPLAPLALMQGFKRGENAVLPEGKRFVVVVSKESKVTAPLERR